jgi:predicted alpha/beta-fold hydrolase
MGNYVARSGADCALDAAVAISGGLDMRYETHFYRAQRLWQPLLTETLRNDFVVGKWGERVRERLTKEQMKMMMRATHISEIDKTAVVAYNGFRDLDHYYSEMSVLGDIPMNEHNSENQKTKGRVDQISIPFCVVVRFGLPRISTRRPSPYDKIFLTDCSLCLFFNKKQHSLDDPLITWRSVAANEGLLHPNNLTQRGSGNMLILLTKQGGHVGWVRDCWCYRVAV